MYRRILALGIVMAICFAVGCGSSGSDTASSPLTKPQYIKQAEAICTKVYKEVQKAAAAWKKQFPGGAAEAEEHADDGLRKVVVPSIEREAEQLEALKPPAKDKAVVDRFVEKLAESSKVLEDGGLKALPKSGVLKFKQEATAYGLKSCGSAL